MISDVERVKIEPIINEHVKEKSIIYTDEYKYKTVCHSKQKYVRDENGFCEVYVNTIQ